MVRAVVIIDAAPVKRLTPTYCMVPAYPEHWSCPLPVRPLYIEVLYPSEERLKSLVYTLNKIWLDEQQAVVSSYPQIVEESEGYLKAAEERKI